MDLKNLPREEKTCVNCEHYRRNWSPFALVDLLFDNGALFHRCTRKGTTVRFNTITGKKTVKLHDRSCIDSQGFDCGHENRNWEPSEKWKKKKENLFKMLQHGK